MEFTDTLQVVARPHVHKVRYLGQGRSIANLNLLQQNEIFNKHRRLEKPKSIKSWKNVRNILGNLKEKRLT